MRKAIRWLLRQLGRWTKYLPRHTTCKVGNVLIEVDRLLDDEGTKVQVNGIEQMWIDKVTVIVELGEAPRVILEGPAVKHPREG